MTARPHETGTIELGGRIYAWKTPKVAIIMSAMFRAKGLSEEESNQILLEAQAKWIRAGVGKQAWQEIEQRMFEDEDDPMDWPEIIHRFNEKVAEASNRPFTSSSGSPDPLPETSPSVEKPKQPGSIFGD